MNIWKKIQIQEYKGKLLRTKGREWRIQELEQADWEKFWEMCSQTNLLQSWEFGDAKKHAENVWNRLILTDSAETSWSLDVSNRHNLTKFFNLTLDNFLVIGGSRCSVSRQNVCGGLSTGFGVNTMWTPHRCRLEQSPWSAMFTIISRLCKFWGLLISKFEAPKRL